MLQPTASSRLLNFFGKAIIPFYRGKLARFEQSLVRGRAEQQATLRRILEFGANTAIGRDFAIDRIRTIDDFRRQLPIVGFEHFAPYIDRVAHGELTALFPPGEKLLTFVQTSATTGRPKIIPVNQTWFKNYSRDWDVWGVKAYADHPNMMGQPILQMSGVWNLGYTPGGHNIAAISAMIEKYQSPIITMLYALPPDLKHIPDVDARGYCLVRIAATKSIGLISTVTPSSILQIAEWTGKFGEQLVRDLYQGTLDPRLNLPREVRDRITPGLKKKLPELARSLEKAIEANGVLRPKDIWRPAMISCWLGGTVGYTAGRIPELFGNVPMRDQGLLSTEGRHTIPLADGVPYGPLAVGASYYEFIPADEAVGPGATILEAHELEQDRLYRIIMTTIGGLYRYDIGDIVKCVGFMGETPVIEFMQKDGSYCDLEGEKLSAFTVCQAAVKAQAAAGLTISCFTVAPQVVAGQRPRYVMVVEEPEAGNHRQAAEFLRAFDADLCENVHIYGIVRKNRLLEAPVLARIPAGGWRDYVASKVGSHGGGDSQYKHKPLVADPAFLSHLPILDLWEPDAEGRIHTTALSAPFPQRAAG